MNGFIRKLTIDEWFLNLQLGNLKDHFFLPIFIEVDVTSFQKKYLAKNKHPPYALYLIKSASQFIHENPEYNEVYFNTIFGKKIATLGYNAVNVPIEITHNQQSYISAVSVQDAYKKSLEDIGLELKKEKMKTLDDLPINKIIHGKEHPFIKKIKLSFIFFIFSNFPKFYLKNKAGGISVSSLFATNKDNRNMHINAYGLTTFTLCSATILEQNDKTIMKIGIGFSHAVTHGLKGSLAVNKLAQVLERTNI